MEDKSKGMRVHRGNSGSGLFLMEMIVAVFFFMICVSICILGFAKSDHMSRNAKNLNQAILAAESTAEIWKAAGDEGLEKQMQFAVDPQAGSDVLTAQYLGFLIRVETTGEEGGITDAVIHIVSPDPVPGDPEEIFRLETKRYERIN
jgi:hypothetical protein